MKVVQRVELRLEGFEKCSLTADHDTPLGTLYDYSCALKAFICDKIKESEPSQSPQAPCSECEEPKE